MYATPEYIYRAVQAGAKGYLIKESAGEEVVAAVRAVLAGRRYLSHQIAEAMIDDFIELRQAQSVENPLDSLSPREREVLQLVVEGYSAPEIGAKLALSPRSIDTYRSRIMAKLGINNLPDLVKFAIRHGLTSV
jgi:DNA-binding NarL/FixJ family response regulator